MAQMPKKDSVTTFIVRENIERYRRLLRTQLDAQQRQTILDLLVQAEAAEREVVGATEGLASVRAGHVAA